MPLRKHVQLSTFHYASAANAIELDLLDQVELVLPLSISSQNPRKRKFFDLSAINVNIDGDVLTRRNIFTDGTTRMQ